MPRDPTFPSVAFLSLAHVRPFIIAATLLLGCSELFAQSSGYNLRGYLWAHDPSTIIRCKDRFYIFSTGQGIISKSSSDKIFWSVGPQVFASPPSWTTTAIPGFRGVFWAPDILFFNNKYYLYYAVSTTGSQVSAIGLATNPTLDPNDPAYRWTDQGPVIQSRNGFAYNTIDPSFVWDEAGNLWMSFGSFWDGIYVVQLDPITGLLLSPTSQTFQVAFNSSIEASYIYRRDPYYYLFVNWGACCLGVNSTYEVRVGRSISPTGPYLDRKGQDMLNRGGNLFMRGTGKFTGPGHVAIFSDGTNEWFTYHYYDANAWDQGWQVYGRPTLGLAPLSWTEDHWPVFTNDWSAVYNFDVDCAEANGQYYGLLQNGASIQNDPVHGHVLDLSGAGQYAWLPPGVGYGQTFAAVVKWRGGGHWQRIFDFGLSTNHTFMITPASDGNVLRCDLYPNHDFQSLQWNKPLPINVWTHIAVTFDGTRGVLYVNGAAVTTNNAMKWLPADVAMQTNHLGRSKFTADPYFNGQIASFRSYGRALSATEILDPLPRILQPVGGSTWSPGATITFAGEATDFADVPLAPTNLTWAIKYYEVGQSNLVFGPLSGVTNGVFVVPSNTSGTGIYNVILTATDGAHQGTFSVPLRRADANSDWSSFYSFTIDARDESNRFNGVLIGGASIQTGTLQGSVLNLSSSGQYVSLDPGVSSAQTFSGWVNWRGGDSWQRIFDFGRDTNHWFILTPNDASGFVRCAIAPDGQLSAQAIATTTSFPLNTWTHVAVVLDGRQGILYLNGNAVAVNNSVNALPSDVPANQSSFGRSEYPANPYFDGELDSIFLSPKALSGSAIKQAFLSPTLTSTVGGGALSLSWPQWAASMQLYTTTNLAQSTNWRSVTNVPSMLNGLLTVTLPANSGHGFYRLQWP